MKGLEDSGYTKMPRMEESLAGYLTAPQASSWKAPTLPSKPCQFTFRLVGKAYTAAGQAGGTQHTISVLQAYQTDLLKDADTAGGRGSCWNRGAPPLIWPPCDQASGLCHRPLSCGTNCHGEAFMACPVGAKGEGQVLSPWCPIFACRT